MGKNGWSEPIKETQITESQFSFMLGNSTIEMIYLLRCVMKWYLIDQKDLHLFFINLENAQNIITTIFFQKYLDKKWS